ncbi:TPA: 23S rRNA methyltransferase attenuation leader peptide, partial [Enterococcus faecium]|nr:23S rRNA methyltransferase attenuation leader peptide [Enterococcus faecalis]HAP8604644.1 23S rRNA methyltransferase attenuation leader peptide [Enterococcus faecium]HBL3466697.1 23S rRNA methyltransferase attenuation leader peptide [Enterococcus faecium]HBM6606798.1 23S rRNA methyltransferase attenuation leader peptide [Enterococcus faecium]
TVLKQTKNSDYADK